MIFTSEIEVSRQMPLGSHVIGQHSAGSFTGEAATLAGRAAIATGRALTDCEVIVVEEDARRTLVVAEADLSETIMRASILRRVAYIEDAVGAD